MLMKFNKDDEKFEAYCKEINNPYIANILRLAREKDIYLFNSSCTKEENLVKFKNAIIGFAGEVAIIIPLNLVYTVGEIEFTSEKYEIGKYYLGSTRGDMVFEACEYTNNEDRCEVCDKPKTHHCICMLCKNECDSNNIILKRLETSEMIFVDICKAYENERAQRREL